MNENPIKGYTIGPHGYRYHNIILAMQPKWADKLLDGSKKIELRRSTPRKPITRGCLLYLYSKKHIIGHVMLERLRPVILETLIHEAMPTFRLAGMKSPNEVLEYLDGSKNPCLFYVSSPVRYTTPIPWPHTVQSWVYVPERVR